MAVAAAVLGAGAHTAIAQDTPPFGQPEDVAYAAALWSALDRDRLVGAQKVLSMPYEGNPPHGAMLEYLERQLRVGETLNRVIVKNNYAGEDLDRQQVLASPQEYLASVTVMYRREEGYDPENQNWFWAKYNPDGSLQTNPKGVSLAGRVAKGMDQGCIACHSAAPGGDYVYTYDLQAPE